MNVVNSWTTSIITLSRSEMSLWAYSKNSFTSEVVFESITYSPQNLLIWSDNRGSSPPSFSEMPFMNKRQPQKYLQWGSLAHIKAIVPSDNFRAVHYLCLYLMVTLDRVPKHFDGFDCITESLLSLWRNNDQQSPRLQISTNHFRTTIRLSPTVEREEEGHSE